MHLGIVQGQSEPADACDSVLCDDRGRCPGRCTATPHSRQSLHELPRDARCGLLKSSRRDGCGTRLQCRGP
eukprot:1431452-Prymnesium_polylepis.1